jgi:hypothetical protein
MLANSCSPDTFVLNKYEGDNLTYVRMLNGIEKAKKINENSLEIKPDAIVSLKFIEETQFINKFNLTLKSGNGVSLYLYTTEAEFGEQKNIKVNLTREGYKIIKNEEIIAGSDSIKLELNKSYRIKIQKEGNLLKFSVDCADITIQVSNYVADEYLIFQTDRTSEIQIDGITKQEN